MEKDIIIIGTILCWHVVGKGGFFLSVKFADNIAVIFTPSVGNMQYFFLTVMNLAQRCNPFQF